MTHKPMFLVGNNFTRAQKQASRGKPQVEEHIVDPKQQSISQFLNNTNRVAKIEKPKTKSKPTGYWEQRVAKLKDQKPDLEIFKHFDIVKKGTLVSDKENLSVKQIFKGLSFYFNGRSITCSSSAEEISNSNLSQLQLNKLSVLHGATVLLVTISNY
jgi:hypothetical protein